jgi:hypothetical protein
MPESGRPDSSTTPGNSIPSSITCAVEDFGIHNSLDPPLKIRLQSKEPDSGYSCLGNPFPRSVPRESFPEIRYPGPVDVPPSLLFYRLK